MRAAVLEKLGSIVIKDIPIPELQSDYDVQVKVKAVGICGTDLHMFREARSDVSLPRIMGHELSGIVTKIGSKVTRVKEGDRVVLDPVFACGECQTCKKGYPNVCENVKCYGVQMNGGYQDYIVVGEEHLYSFSPKISFEEAALAEPFSIASNIAVRSAIKTGENVLILGCGTIGLSVLSVAKSLGARVMISDVVDDKLKLALKIGADCVVNSKSENIKEKCDLFSPGGFDVILDAVGATSLFESSFSYAAPRARIVCIGFDGKPANIPPVWITKKELTIVGSRMNCHRFPIVMQWLKDGKIDANLMISAKYSIDDIQMAFEKTVNNPGANVKTLILFE